MLLCTTNARHLAALVATATLAALCWASPARAATYTFTAVADAWVEAASPTTNFSGSSSLYVDLSPQEESYVTFDLSSLPSGEPITSATLRVSSADSSVDGPAVHGASTSWTESGLTWNTRPSRDAAATDDVGAVAAGSVVAYDVSSRVAGGGPVSFAFIGTSSDGVSYGSRESSSTRPTLEIVTTADGAPVPTPTPTADGFFRGVWTKSSSAQTEFDTVGSLGFQYAQVDPELAELDRLAAAELKPLLWLGNYDDDACVWRWSDATLTTKLNAVKHHPLIADAIAFVADEPHSAASGGCASAPSQIRQRHALVKSILPTVPTMLSENRREDYANLAHTTDIFAAIRYPCSYSNGCSMSKITETANAVRAAGIDWWWGVPQAFKEPSSGYYRAPTASEMRQIIDTWKAQPGIDGLFTYTWGDGCCGDDIGLRDLPDVWPVWQAENGAPPTPASSTVEPGLAAASAFERTSGQVR